VDLLLIAALVFSLLAAGFLATAIWAARRKRILGGLTALLVTLLMLALGALAAAFSVGTQGYRALTKEVVAAVVEVEPTGEQAFRAVVHLPDSTTQTYDLRGDQVYVDARVLKWKPVANVLGLHTEYELDRVAGRYMEIEDERKGPRTVHPLGEDKPIDVFDLRRRFSALTALVDAEYGSASYVAVDDTATLEVRVSTSGLLIRRAGSDGG
jgi:hypothetical protein